MTTTLTTTLLHVSDPHITEDRASVGRLFDVLDLLPASRQPDALVITGDIADHGYEAEYLAFAEAMPDDIPWLAIPGNHDHPDTLRAVLNQDLCPVLDVGGVRVIGLDVTVPGADDGMLAEDTADLAVERAAGAERVVLALHQPPVATGHAGIDSMLLTNPDALVDLIRRLPPVLAVLCGHIHTPLASTLAGTPIRTAPGIASTLMLDRRPPYASQEGQPGMALHRITGDVVTTSFHYPLG